MDAIKIPISFGEVVDKISILQIKTEKMNDPRKVEAVRSELKALQEVWDRHFGIGFDGVLKQAARLKEVNAILWNIEDAIRDCERRKAFDHEFIRLARAIYATNDDRAAIKREIDTLLGSPLREQKAYTHYSDDRGVERVEGCKPVD